MVLAAGAWSAELIRLSFYDQFYAGLLSPRAGHLLEMPYPHGVAPLGAAVMDAAYSRYHVGKSSPFRVRTMPRLC